MAAIVEKHHDGKGIIWPANVAPFRVHLIGLNLTEKDVNCSCYNLYNRLLDKGVEVLFDDRGVSPGEKFADADLIGIPVRLVVSKKTEKMIEYKERNSNESKLVTETELFTLL
jgi:prolyl-tRNA synthetase